MTKYYTKWVFANLIGQPTYTSLCDEPDWRLSYSPGVWVYPPVPESRLFISQNVREAYNFLESLERCHPVAPGLPQGMMLWWCVAQDVELPKQPIYRGLPAHLIAQFWEQYPRFDLPGRVYPLEVRHLLASAVRLISIVTNEEVSRLLKDG